MIPVAPWAPTGRRRCRRATHSTGKVKTMAAGATYQTPGYTTDDGGRTGWTGWIAFAGVMMVVAGTLNAIYGLIAVINDDWAVWTNSGSLLVDISNWGWVHLVVGLVVLASGVGVFSGNVLARTVGVIAATISLIVNFFFIPAYPIWAITVMTIDVLVIWALTAHGAEMRRP